jgi:hypothetical protein
MSRLMSCGEGMRLNVVYIDMYMQERVVIAFTTPFECVTVDPTAYAVTAFFLSLVTAPLFLSLVRVSLCTYDRRTTKPFPIRHIMPFATT